MKLLCIALRFGVAAACTALLFACANYHKVRDLSSGKEYYTADLNRYGNGVHFTDARTGSQISLPSSEVSEIPEDLYRQAVSTPMLIMPPVVPPTPASAGK